MIHFLNSGHDTDGDEMIDGLELYKAIHHAKVHKESHEHKLPEQAPPPGVPQLHFDPELEAFIEGTEDIGAIGNWNSDIFSFVVNHSKSIVNLK